MLYTNDDSIQQTRQERVNLILWENTVYGINFKAVSVEFSLNSQFQIIRKSSTVYWLEFLYKMMTENVILFLKIPDNLRLTVFDLNGTVLNV